VAMHDDVNITSLPLSQESQCNKSSDSNLEFFSPEGIVRLEILNIFFVKLSYSVVTSVLGRPTHNYLL